MEEELEKDSGRDMTPKLIGETYMRYPTEKSRDKIRYGLYECAYCGKEFETLEYSVGSGATKSCGCLVTKHGISRHRFYGTWSHMLRRCTNPKDAAYKDYGARGITVCEEWLNVSNFVAWCDLTFPNIEGHTLDRIDNDKGYYPENCRWVDRAMQSINQRMQKNNTSGFVGVYRDKNRWTARIRIFNKEQWIGTFKTKEEAVQARDNYIIENNLPNKLSTDYKKEK